MMTTQADYVDALLGWWHESTEQDRLEGASWYRMALTRCDAIARQCNFETHDVVHALAALSPLREWDLNVRQTLEVARAVRGKRKVPSVHFGARVRAAINALRGKAEVSGPKVEAFASAILGDTSACVIDTHMLKAMGWQPAYFPKRCQYARLASALTRAAHDAGVPVTTFQATVWLVVRRTHGRFSS